jgi:hypothetical protein
MVFFLVILWLSPAAMAQDQSTGIIHCPATALFVINASLSPRNMILTLGRFGFSDTGPLTGLSLSWKDGAFADTTSVGPINAQRSIAIALSLAPVSGVNLKCTGSYNLLWQVSTLNAGDYLACGNGFSTTGFLVENTTSDSLFLFFSLGGLQALDSFNPAPARIELSWKDPVLGAQSTLLDNETSLGVAINLAAFSNLKYSCTQDVATWNLVTR